MFWPVARLRYSSLLQIDPDTHKPVLALLHVNPLQECAFWHGRFVIRKGPRVLRRSVAVVS